MVNLFEAEFQYDNEDPEGYRCGTASVGRDAGGTANAVKLYEMPAGQSLCPYHYEYEEEWLLVLDGDLILRTPEGEQAIGRGALVCFPAGPGGAHKLTNRAEAAAHILMFSSAREPAVAVYPDSDKIGVFPPEARDRLMVRRANGQEDYYAGEV